MEYEDYLGDFEEEYGGYVIEEEEKQRVPKKTAPAAEEKPSLDRDIMVAEMLSNRRLLTLLLHLGKPREFKALTRYIPESTLLRILRKLEEMGVAKRIPGIDGRRKWVKLTGEGMEIRNEALRLLKTRIARRMRKAEDVFYLSYGSKYEGYLAAELEKWRKIVEEIGVPRGVLEEALEVKYAEKNYKQYVLMRR